MCLLPVSNDLASRSFVQARNTCDKLISTELSKNEHREAIRYNSTSAPSTLAREATSDSVTLQAFTFIRSFARRQVNVPLKDEVTEKDAAVRIPTYVNTLGPPDFAGRKRERFQRDDSQEDGGDDLRVIRHDEEVQVVLSRQDSMVRIISVKGSGADSSADHAAVKVPQTDPESDKRSVPDASPQLNNPG